ncbi:MAG: branched-chain amino acid ABC transporter permease [Bacilli bacterium]|nr:branched-chain amino acid ABC transporter permease [Bacilli bacterium]
MDAHQIIITIASVITALGVIFGAVFAFHNWLLKREKNDTDIKAIKEEQSILTKGVLACLKGLKEQGCNGPVTEAIQDIEEYVNKQAHK